MDHSILIVGDPAFRLMIQGSVGSLGAVNLVYAEDCIQAGLSMQANQPDLMVLQVDPLSEIEACLHLKERNRFRWVYILAIEGCCLSQGGVQRSELERNQRAAAMVQAGADTYLWLTGMVQGDQIMLQPEAQALLEAQMKVGMTSVKRYRELLQTNDLLSTIALIDPLTELSNRRALDWDLPRQIKRSRDRNRPLSLMIFDLDFFKGINDNYGHLVGDVSLKLLSARLRHNLRSNDTLFRYGGEEFVVILSDTHAPEAGEIGQRLCRMISSQAFTINDDLELSLTVSVGVAYLQEGDDPQGLTLLERADRRLRQAKQNGRNRVVTH